MSASVLALLLAVLIASSARAEVVHTAAPATNPNDPARIFGLRIPFRTGPAESQTQLTLEGSTANTWQPTAALRYRDSFKIYGADGVLRSAAIRLTQRIDAGSEFEVCLTMFGLVTGTAAIDAFVSDDFIEKFHSFAARKEDPFQRRQAGYNQAGLVFRDRAGNVARVERDETFLGTLDLAYLKFIELFRNDRVLVTLRLGVFAAVPLNKVNKYLAIGTAGSISATWDITRGVSITTAMGSTAQEDRVAQIGSSGVDLADNPTQFGYQSLAAANFDSARGSRVSVGFEFQGTSAPIASSLVESASRASGLGFHNPQDAKGLPLWRTYRGLTEINHNITFFVSVRPHLKWMPTLTLFVEEDWTPFPTFTGATNPIIEAGSNAQDVAIGLRLRIPIPE